jgi:hypothetical protein
MARHGDYGELGWELFVRRWIRNHSRRHLLRPQRLTSHPGYSEQCQDDNSVPHALIPLIMVVGAIMHFERVALRSTFWVDTLVDSEYLEVVRAIYSPILQH